MKILVGVSHPKHVLIFKNVIANLIERGHEIKIVAVEKEITEYLLNRFDMPHTTIGKNQPKFYRKLLGLPKWEYLTYKIAQEFKPDIFIGRALPHLAHVSMLLNKPFIIFEDTEIARLLHKITVPFASSIVTPECYRGDFGKKHIRFNGYFELGYLHPNYFKPVPTVLDELDLDKKDRFTVVRFISWSAIHDINQYGISNEMKIRYISKLKQYGKVFISSESKLEKKFEKYELKIPPEKLHSLLSYAQLYIGESSTMAVESSILGTPSIYASSLVGTMGNLDELQNRYGLMHSFQDSKLALDKALELLEDENTKKKWQKKRENLLNEKIDVTKFMTEFIEGYPESFENYKQRCDV